MLYRKVLFAFLAGSGCGLSAYVYQKEDRSWFQPAQKDRQKLLATEIGTITAPSGKKSSALMKTRMESLVERAQSDFCREVARLEGERFSVEKYQKKPSKGHSIVCVLQGGKVFERVIAITNVSEGNVTEEMEKHMTGKGKNGFQRTKDGKLPFATVGISVVAHPTNPHCPSLHFNYRFFEVTAGNNERTHWFGGGIDLTPAYLDEEDARHFHETIKKACDKHDASYYDTFKRWCDNYHYLSIYKEHRGIGGIFFDDLNSDDPEKLLEFVETCMDSTIPAYIPIIEKNMDKEFTPKEKRWQQIRRGRYVDFNLLYDRGVKFGLLSPYARIENVMATLPLTARWEYRNESMREVGSPEAQMMSVLKNPRDWVKQDHPVKD